MATKDDSDLRRACYARMQSEVLDEMVEYRHSMARDLRPSEIVEIVFEATFRSVQLEKNRTRMQAGMKAAATRARSRKTGKKGAASVGKKPAKMSLAPVDVDRKVLELGKGGPFMIGAVITKAGLTRGVASSAIKRLLKAKMISKQGGGRFASYTLRQLELPNGTTAEA